MFRLIQAIFQNRRSASISLSNQHLNISEIPKHIHLITFSNELRQAWKIPKCQFYHMDVLFSFYRNVTRDMGVMRKQRLTVSINWPNNKSIKALTIGMMNQNQIQSNRFQLKSEQFPIKNVNLNWSTILFVFFVDFTLWKFNLKDSYIQYSLRGITLAWRMRTLNVILAGKELRVEFSWKRFNQVIVSVLLFFNIDSDAFALCLFAQIFRSITLVPYYRFVYASVQATHSKPLIKTIWCNEEQQQQTLFFLN